MLRALTIPVLVSSLTLLAACDQPAAPAASSPAAQSKAPSTPAAPGEGKPVVITDANFQSEVLQSTQPVLVDVWATWCGPCKKAAPTIDALAREYAGKVKVGKLDSDANRTIAAKYAGNGIPVFLVFKNGKLVHQALGFNDDKQLRGELVPALEAALK